MSSTGKSTNSPQVLLEDINCKFDFLIELILPMKKQVDLIPEIQENIKEIRSDINIIKVALKETNRKLHTHIQDKIVHLSPKVSTA
jgi:hypothetical protein